MAAVMEDRTETEKIRARIAAQGQRFLRRDMPLCPEHGIVMIVYSTRTITDSTGVDRTTQYCRCPKMDCHHTGQCHPRFVT